METRQRISDGSWEVDAWHIIQIEHFDLHSISSKADLIQRRNWLHFHRHNASATPFSTDEAKIRNTTSDSSMYPGNDVRFGQNMNRHSVVKTFTFRRPIFPDPTPEQYVLCVAATSVVGALSRFAPVMGSLKFAAHEDPSVAVQPLLIMLGYDSTSMDDIVAYGRYVATVLKWQSTNAASVQVLLIEPRRLVAMTFPLLSLGGVTVFK